MPMRNPIRWIFSRKRCALITSLLMTLLLTVPMTVAVVWAHGGKTHQDAFTALQALQKATALYDQLIIKGKLDESWETGLNAVEVTMRDSKDRKEYRVGFHRQSGSPEAVYIFFSPEGEYSGSNFDGKW